MGWTQRLRVNLTRKSFTSVFTIVKRNCLHNDRPIELEGELFRPAFFNLSNFKMYGILRISPYTF